MGDISKGMANTLQATKQITKKRLFLPSLGHRGFNHEEEGECHTPIKAGAWPFLLSGNFLRYFHENMYSKTILLCTPLCIWSFHHLLTKMCLFMCLLLLNIYWLFLTFCKCIHPCSQNMLSYTCSGPPGDTPHHLQFSCHSMHSHLNRENEIFVWLPYTHQTFFCYTFLTIIYVNCKGDLKFKFCEKT